MSPNERSVRQLIEMGYLEMLTPTTNRSAFKNTLDEILSPLGLEYRGIHSISMNTVTKFDIQDVNIIWFEGVNNGESMRWFYHPSKQDQMMLFKLSL